ncbi:MAG: hypothetical protein WAM65_18030, partial [Candidatus Korobacteraceae bacterium]
GEGAEVAAAAGDGAGACGMVAWDVDITGDLGACALASAVASISDVAASTAHPKLFPRRNIELRRRDMSMVSPMVLF